MQSVNSSLQFVKLFIRRASFLFHELPNVLKRLLSNSKRHWFCRKDCFKLTTRPAKLLKWTKSSAGACGQQQAHSLEFYHSLQSAGHPPPPSIRRQHGNDAAQMLQRVAVRGQWMAFNSVRLTSDTNCEAQSVCTVPRMTAEWHYAHKRRKIHWTQLSGPRTSYAHNRIMQISDMHLSRVASHWKSLASNGTALSLCS